MRAHMLDNALGCGSPDFEDAEDDMHTDACAAPAPMSSRRAPAPMAPRYPSDPAGKLARSQAADGSFGGDVTRTAAALLALVLLGHTRRAGLRKRTVVKAAAWLANHATHPHAAAALAALEAAERGESPPPAPTWRQMTHAGDEGSALATALGG